MAQSTKTPPKTRRKPPSKLVQMPAGDTPEPPPQATEPEDSPPEPPPEGIDQEPVSKKAFPVPPRGIGKGGYCDPIEGMNYWRKLPAEFARRLNVYVNREWPILNRIQELPPEERAMIAARKKREPYKYIDKPAEAFGPDWEMEFLRRYGSGKYKVYINDAGVGRKQTDPDLQPHNLCKFLVKVHDSDFPPILDPQRADKGLAILDRDHPENASYITELRFRGVLPLQNPGDSEMGLADTVKELAAEVAGAKQDNLLTKIKEEFAALSARNGGSANTHDLMLMKMLELMMTRPAQETASPVVTMLQGQIQALQVELREERNERRKYEDSIRAKAEQPAPDPFTWFERMVTTLEKGKQIFGAPPAANGAAAEATRHLSRMSGTMEFFSELIPKILDAPILNALAARITAGTTAAGSEAAAATAPAANSAQADAQLLKFVQDTITPAMLGYLQEGNSGGDFAEWVYCGFPERLQELQKRGPAVILATYQQSALWATKLAMREIQFRRFVAEFCAWKPTEDHEAEPEVTTAAAPAGVNGAAAAGPVIIDLDAALEGDSIEGAPIV